MRRIGLQIVRRRLRAQASAPASPTEVPCGGISSNGDPRTGHRTSVRLTHSSPAQRRCHLHPNPVSHRGGEQGSPTTGGSTTPLRQGSRRAAWWDGPGPALPRGPSLDGLKTNTVDLREWRIPRQGASHAPPSCTGITWEAEYSLAQPEVLACGPVPARTAGLPDGDDTRVGLPVGRTRSIAAGSPSACRRDRPAGRHHGFVRRGRPGYGHSGIHRLESRLSQPYWCEDQFYGRS